MLTFNRNLLIIGFILLSSTAYSQTAWTWTQKADMPEKIANNAVSHGEMAGNPYVFSFGGIDTTKIYSGINKRAFRYDVNNDIWDEIDTLPVVLPLVASSANTVKNKLYILGGYHVQSNGNEISSVEVIIYDPETDTYEANGASIPVPIDDQTQCVWRDSLIYVITGWSNSGNVPNIQIYDPALDSWSVGTDLPDDNFHKAFGSSGTIIGDTIFYYGGASTGWNFPARKDLRKGVINSSDPTQITWTLEEEGINSNYRSACISHGSNIFWVGGSETSYNYNGIAYNGSGGVEPAYSISRYDAQSQIWFEGTGSPFGIMDMRGSGQVSATSWVVCGGMEDGQQVSDQTYLLEYDPIVGSVSEIETPGFKIVNREIIFEKQVQDVRLIGVDGKIIQQISNNIIPANVFGIYILQFNHNGQKFNSKIKLD
ncbi:MAG: hypothetical protein ACI857_000155 [Arenicella sp.]|jgi:hypothetical protein